MRSMIDAACLRIVHWVARGAVRLQPPLAAKRTVDQLARRLPALDVESAQSAMNAIAGSGTCLSRAMAVGARLPGAEVVIGLDARVSSRPAGHAWVEVDGLRIDTATAAFGGEEIGRLPPTAERRAERQGAPCRPSR